MASLLARFGGEQSGNVAILFAASLVVLLLAIGAAVDVARWMHARDQTAAAIDAALLAGGRALQTDSDDETGAVEAAQRYYDQNVKSRLPVVGDTVDFTVVDDGTAMTASGTAYLKTPFLRLANIDKLPLTNLSETEFSKAELAVGGNGGENLEIAMMLDITGSMCNHAPSSNQSPCSSGKKLDALKAAASDLVNIVVWDDQSEFTSKVALVPFSEDIRLPTQNALDMARSSNLPSEKTISSGGGGWGWGGGGGNSTTYYLSDCVVERVGSQRYTDAMPKRNQYVLGHYTEDYTQTGGNNGGGGGWGWGGGGGGGNNNKEGKCAVSESAAIVPLSSNKDDLLAKINGLQAKGGTAGHLGTAWAWYALSPEWSGLWSSANRPAAYGTDKLKKIAILMTDGEYNTQYDSDGVSVDANKAANGSSTSQARSLCAAMKAKGVEVYTVGFELGGSYSEAYQTLNQCASEPGKFYDAKNEEQLKQAFRDIAIKLSSLYLSK
jgi:Flp pilus assembly protein TadG